MTAFEEAFEKVIIKEGGYSNNPADKGGQTMYGITERVARANGFTDAMRNLSLDDAAAIYKRQYWDVLRLDEIGAVSLRIAEELFDTGVNMGVATAGKFLQRALNALNRQAADYPDLTVDGVLGPVTVDALKSFLYRRDKQQSETVMLSALNCLQAARYIEIAEADRTQEAFVYGWLRNRVGF